MEHKFTNLEDCKVEILSTVPADIWKDAQAKALKKACEQVSIPGFRKGHAPEAMAKSHVNGQKVIDEAINEILPTIFADAVKEGKIEPFFRPDVEVTKLSDTDLEVKFTVTLAPKVTLGEYTGLHVEKNVPSVDEKEVADAISARLERNAELVVTDEEAKNGDTVVIDFEGFIDGLDVLDAEIGDRFVGEGRDLLLLDLVDGDLEGGLLARELLDVLLGEGDLDVLALSGFDAD